MFLHFLNGMVGNGNRNVWLWEATHSRSGVYQDMSESVHLVYSLREGLLKLPSPCEVHKAGLRQQNFFGIVLTLWNTSPALPPKVQPLLAAVLEIDLNYFHFNIVLIPADQNCGHISWVLWGLYLLIVILGGSCYYSNSFIYYYVLGFLLIDVVCSQYPVGLGLVNKYSEIHKQLYSLR